MGQHIWRYDDAGCPANLAFFLRLYDDDDETAR